MNDWEKEDDSNGIYRLQTLVVTDRYVSHFHAAVAPHGVLPDDIVQTVAGISSTSGANLAATTRHHPTQAPNSVSQSNSSQPVSQTASWSVSQTASWSVSHVSPIALGPLHI